ncbi:MAG TPA: MlaD family protein [Polyangiaceae bacterium]|jgi:phospholipid/cholesterol/gamma-HCH transport system substrate-binding protein|nr:MlaD family protein [Polyangiaceae bacterium]
MASSRSIEVKVGVLILSALGLLAAFMLVMGGINFQPTYDLYVDFDNPGGLQTGAPVKIAGVKVGKIEEIQFRGGKTDEKTGRREPLVRIKISVEKRYEKSVYENSLFYVTTQGVLGEQFMAIEPGSSDRDVLPEGAVVRGLDPPRLDMLLAESYELLHSTVAAVRDNRKEISETFDALRITLKGTGTFFSNNQDKLDRIVTNVETATVEGNDLIKGANEKFVKNPQVDRIIDNVDSVTAQANREAPQIIADTKATLANAKRASDAVGSEEQAAKLKKAVDGGVALVDKANATMNDAQYMTAQIRKGRGTVGALLMDEQLFDDLQEMVRDLKHNPWKFFWRE